MDTTGSEQRFIHFTGEVLCVRFGLGGHEGEVMESCPAGCWFFWAFCLFLFETEDGDVIRLFFGDVLFVLHYNVFIYIYECNSFAR